MAKKGKLQTSAEYAAVRFILSVLGALPIRQSMWLGRVFGRIAYLLARDLRRTAEINLKIAFPEKSGEERSKTVKGCFENLGRALGLFSHLSKDSHETLRSIMEVEALEHFEAARKTGRGLILFTAHLGAWELTSYGMALLGHPFSFVVRPMDNPKIEQLVNSYRTSSGNKTLDKFSAGRSMVKILRTRAMLGLLFDLNALDDEAIFVDFFGVPASTNFLTAKLALRTDSPIVPFVAPWDSARKKFLWKVLPAVMPEASGNEEEDVRRLTERLTLIIEQQIRLYPEQWLWIHKRWKTRPKGEPSIY